MINSKTIKLLITFTKSEFRDFGLFVNSPFHNREKVLVKFFDILKKHYPDFSHKNLNRKIVYPKLFPGKKYNDSLFRNTVSDFLRLAENFLKIYHFNKQKFYAQYLLLKELTDKKQNSLFKINFKKAEKILNAGTARDELYYQNKFLLEDEWRRNHIVSSSRMLFEEDNLKQQSDSLHVYYLTEFTKLYAILLNQSKYTYDYKFNYELFEAVTEFLKNNFRLYKDIPYINIFYNCVMLYKTEDMTYFVALKKLLLKFYKILTFTDRKNIFVVLINYCNEQISRGKYFFHDEIFLVNEHLLKSKAYFEGNDFMPHYFYESIALNAVELRKCEWAEKFLSKYRKIVHPEFRESSYNFCMAEISYSKNNLEKALEYLSLVIPEDVKSRIKINILLMRIYFSGNDSNQFQSLLESSRKYIIRNKTVQEINKKRLANFLTFIKKLYRIKMDSEFSHELKILGSNIKDCTELYAKKWLEEQVRNLDSKVKMS